MATLRSAFRADGERYEQQAEKLERLAELVSPDLAGKYRDAAKGWRQRGREAVSRFREPKNKKG